MPERGYLMRAVGKVRELGLLVDRFLPGEQDASEAEMAALARRLLFGQALEAAAALSQEDVAALSPEKLAQMLVRLEQTRIAAGRLRLQESRAKDKAKEEIIAEMEAELPDRPDLLDQLIALLNEEEPETAAAPDVPGDCLERLEEKRMDAGGR
ncbi:MAG: hypothetical protein O2807_05950 [bacterium]|nr:hypothetical protein [bacterium]